MINQDIICTKSNGMIQWRSYVISLMNAINRKGAKTVPCGKLESNVERLLLYP